MINFDYLIELSDGYSEWQNVTVDNVDQFFGFVSGPWTIRNIKRLGDI